MHDDFSTAEESSKHLFLRFPKLILWTAWPLHGADDVGKHSKLPFCS